MLYIVSPITSMRDNAHAFSGIYIPFCINFEEVARYNMPHMPDGHRFSDWDGCRNFEGKTRGEVREVRRGKYVVPLIFRISSRKIPDASNKQFSWTVYAVFPGFFYYLILFCVSG